MRSRSWLFHAAIHSVANSCAWASVMARCSWVWTSTTFERAPLAGRAPEEASQQSALPLRRNERPETFPAGPPDLGPRAEAPPGETVAESCPAEIGDPCLRRECRREAREDGIVAA